MREPFWWPMAEPPLRGKERWFMGWSYPWVEPPVEPARDLVYLDHWEES